VTIETEDGSEHAFHAFHSVAQNELARVRPCVGDRLGVKYLGKVSGANARSSYHGYRIRTAGTRSGVNWARYGEGAEDVAADTANTLKPPAAKSMQDRAAERFGSDIPFDDD
jgi:hypothetical protein